MLPLYLLAAHLVGDFVFQTRWQAGGKAGWTNAAVALRARHVLAYSVPFVPLAIIYSPDVTRAILFMAWLYVLHFLTDSRRFHSTVGDWVAWRLGSRVETVAVADPALFYRRDKITLLDKTATVVGHRSNPGESFAPYLDVRFDLEPNPWAPVPILIDQALHVVQVAVLAGLLLS